MIRSFLFLLLLFNSLLGFAQVEMADKFRADGKIYIVIAIILTILLSFFFLIIKLDRRTKRLEKELREK